nr:ribonuclease H-like domain-containing protein [Tanacetum cinerariifolium]
MRPFRSPVTILNTKDHLGKFDGKADEGFFVRYYLNSKPFRVFNSRTRIVEENLHIRFSENTPNVVDQEKEDNVNNTNNVNAAGTNRVNVVGANTNNELPFDLEMPALDDICAFNFSSDHKNVDEMAVMNNLDTTIQVSPTPIIRIHKDHPIDQVIGDLHSTTQTRNMSKNLEEHGFCTTIHQRTNHKDLQIYLFSCFLSQEEPKKKQDGIFIGQDKYVAKILKKYGFTEVKNASTPIETQNPLLKDEDVYASARCQVNPKVSHLYDVKRIFRARLYRKSTTGGFHFLQCRFISW